MYRKTALMLAMVMILSLLTTGFASALPSSSVEQAKVTSFSADTFGVVVGDNSEITYKAKVSSEKKLKNTDVGVYDDNGNLITYLTDNGVGADEVANDGTYTGSAVVSSESTQKVDYRVKVGSNMSDTHTVSFYNKITDADWAISDRLWEFIDTHESKLEEAGLTDKEITNFMFDFISNYTNVSNVVREDDLTVSFDVSNIASVYMRQTEEAKASVGKTDYAELLEELETKYTTKGDNIDEATIGVYSPYYGYDSSFSYNYRTRAYAMSDAMDYELVDAYYGAQASVENFKKFDQYGIIMVDSHGSNYGGGGYICIPAPGSYDSTDISEGHLVNSGGTICMTGTFFQKYCDMLPNSIVYIGICYGLATTKLSSPLIAQGAAFVSGYDDSVSFTYDGQIMDTFHTRLYTINSSTNTYYTAGEAYSYACNAHGTYDPYSSNRANYICYGNRSVSADAGGYPVTGITLDPTDKTLYHGNTLAITLNVFPAEAKDYTVSWESNNNGIATVNENGVVTAVADGVATITCTVSDYTEDDDNPAVFTATTQITVDGVMPVSGISIGTKFYTLYTGGSGSQINAEVFPSNASNNTIVYTSNNPGVATVSDSGYITPIANGTAIIDVIADNGAFVEHVICNVQEGGLMMANAKGGAYNFTTDTSRAWHFGVIDDRNVLVSGNNGQNSTTSTLTMETIAVSAGDRLTFKWGTSSETTYDSLCFYANSSLVAQISGETPLATYTFTAPSSSNYTFSWRYTKDSSVSVGRDQGYVCDIDVLIAGATHTVCFMDINVKTVISEQTVAHGEGAVAPEAPSHAGYIFIGWGADYSEIRRDIEIMAIYIDDPNYVATTYSVRFLDYDGSLISEQTVEEGKAATAPEIPEHDGMVFIGWDTDYSEVEGNLTVTAVFMQIGDSNADNTVNTGDAVEVLRYAVGLIDFEGYMLDVADMNRDGSVNTGDAVSILLLVVA